MIEEKIKSKEREFERNGVNENETDPNLFNRIEDNNEEKIFIENLRLNQKFNEKLLIFEFLNFLEVYIHTILYVNNVYPQEAFYSYSIYDLKFLKFLGDDEVNEYINEFLKNCENFLFLRFVKKFYILITDADSNKIIEIFNLEIDISDKLYNLNHNEVCLNFKSILYKLYTSLVNRKTHFRMNELNKTFLLCIETKESKVISNVKLFEDISNGIEENFIKNLFKSDLINIVGQREICAIMDDFNYTIRITRNYNE